MPKDYTDYVLVVLDAGDRVYHLKHIRSTKEVRDKNERRELVDERNSHKYLINLDRAYRTAWKPWKKVKRRGPKTKLVKAEWYFGGDKETVEKNGVKKVRRLYTKEAVKIKVQKKPLVSLMPIATVREFLRSKKVGIIFFKEPCTQRCSTCPSKDKDNCPTGLIEPMHISKMHQPSGELVQ